MSRKETAKEMLGNLKSTSYLKKKLSSLDINDMINGNCEFRREKKKVKIGVCIAAETKRDLIELLQEFNDVFTWSYQDLPELSTDIVEECKSVQQKLRRMRPEVLLKIKEEVKKQFDANFLQVVKYSEWVANIVPVPKKYGKVRMDLNKASPKDNFPLPHIDTLVDNTTGYSLFSFMDGFSRYNQIKMHPEDMEKTTFETMWGTFCYKVMPFGLKNVGATYQRAMVTLFHDMMHKKIELKLNLAKCTFRARSGKLLGVVVSEMGIEIDLEKFKAIQELPPSRTQKEVCGFLRRLNYIARFISQLTEKCDPIFLLLKKHNPGSDKPLILYLAIFGNSMGCVLGQHNESGRKERAIYYLIVLRINLDNLKTETVHVVPHNLAHLKTGPSKLHDGVDCFEWKNGLWQILLSEFDIVYMNQKIKRDHNSIFFSQYSSRRL
ncbi:RNA-directed DNA polymerase (Reverse transcriptase), Ribonuclease H-like protein [Gossypium australe]|uniref:RNA-directed DNA polymerase (Reverse transcriptase), Ribonuclease H-like protein n=1 Tax=Gossypium australe TaxID=47621 RepID=A0A5B6UYY8_9ROSI|nr:RNA-directed DNA polymerase (Reverse transcriptase), Ribonuclease H-like protein [Gossypium australe]